VGAIVRGQAGVLLVTAVVTLVTGLVLRFEEASLFARPWVLALVPVINALGGNLGAVLGSRLTSGLHLGMVEPSLERGPLTDNVSVIATASVIVYGTLALVIALTGPWLGFLPAIAFGDALAVVLGSGVLLTVGVIGLSVGSAFLAYRRGLDPDDIVIPVVTSLTDLLGVIVLLGVTEVVL
jgi:mgtE-like transporter